MSFRVIVTGSRTWTDRDAVERELRELRDRHGRLTVIIGACPSGADKFAADATLELGCVSKAYFADWAEHGKAAGPIRNQEMASDGADLCLAFWDGRSPGSSDCIKRCVQQGIPVRIVPSALPPSERAKGDADG